MKLVVIESPYAGHLIKHKQYARRCLLHSIGLGEAPIASHLLYTQVLNDDIPGERKIGIEIGLAWGAHADLVAVYTDWGISPGMKMGIAAAKAAELRIVHRKIL